MTRQVRLDDDVVELVEGRNPEELSLSGRTNELLRALLTPGPAAFETEPEPEPPEPDEAWPETSLTVAPRRRRRRGGGRPLSDAEAARLLGRLGQ